MAKWLFGFNESIYWALESQKILVNYLAILIYLKICNYN
jgi:hypothetical protein